MITLINASAHDTGLDALSVHCIVTSPPYWGLRAYAGEQRIEWPAVEYSPMPGLPALSIPAMTCGLGEETTPEAYIGHLILVMREMKRVLRDDGVAFVNLGDSYFGSNQTGGTNSKEGSAKRMGRMFTRSASVQHEAAYDISGKELGDSQGRDCLCGSLCDVCRVAYRRKSRTSDLLAPMLTASLSLPTLASMGFENGHLPTWDSAHLENHIFPAILGLLHSQDHGAEQLPAFLDSMPDEFSRQLLDVCWQRANRGVCLLCARSLVPDAHESVHKTATPSGIRSSACDVQDLTESPENKNGIAGIDGSLVDHIWGRAFVCSYPHYTTPSSQSPNTLKPKDLCLIPARFALAAQADGWYVRSDIIWAKPNPMPESVTDRPTKAHEYVWLMAKSQRYFYDAEAVKEESSEDSGFAKQRAKGINTWKYNDTEERIAQTGQRIESSTMGNFGTRNRRTVWNIATHSYKGSHFATFPPKLVEPMILAGTSARGVCGNCLAPWERVVEKPDMKQVDASSIDRFGTGEAGVHRKVGQAYQDWRDANPDVTTGWRPTCECPPADPIPATVLDPFNGSGTSGTVALDLGRAYIGVDISKEYVTELAEERIGGTQIGFGL
jgi:DNA modification methylase